MYDEDQPGFANPDSGTGTSTLERTETITQEDSKLDDNSNADRFAHYVTKERIERSRMTGKPVVALCGKVWVPKYKADGYPVCPECKKIYDAMMD
ncbi:DUF3039 domain-containing protein [Alloscardovia macacae]|uniref:DUF3039 domain-containing protein n=1 Tax=Alloscardovia macacae TaxID=1160091 RepID=A0A1Y2SUE9_9BIFI|nr:DUF3039 domain-containing protein [Alloscardovia macacae]OTA26598.1 hypothetical protein B9G54_04235 [Alloscardovia macacae]OTA29016.1 hypothetical protein B9T39_04965 [Alloscardovia macacae]OZG54989.1 hypothetical protein ALMA_0314 [Alloscardovia macacae]